MIELKPNRILRGTWDEVVSLRDEIPSDAMVEVKVYKPRSETDEGSGDFGGKTIGDVYGHLFGTLNFSPPDLAERAEEYLAESGFGDVQSEPDLIR
jgi:hypothetical protein